MNRPMPPPAASTIPTQSTGLRDTDPHDRRGARVLAVCQALYTSSVSIDLTLTGSP